MGGAPSAHIKMKKLLLIAVLLSFSSLLPASSYTGYISAQGGTTSTKIKDNYYGSTTDKTPVYGTAVGIGSSASGLRAEFSWLGRGEFKDTFDFEFRGPWGAAMPEKATATVKMNSFLLNAYYDFIRTKHINLYAGVGMGITSWKADLYGNIPHNYKDTSFTYALHLGASTPLSERLLLDAGASFYHIQLQSKYHLKDIDNFIPHLGLRFIF